MHKVPTSHRHIGIAFTSAEMHGPGCEHAVQHGRSTAYPSCSICNGCCHLTQRLRRLLCTAWDCRLRAAAARSRVRRRLLFHNIKPVFVFDGVAPAIKRRTTLLRRQRRELAAVKTKKIAEKLLLARLKCASPRAC